MAFKLVSKKARKIDETAEIRRDLSQDELNAIYFVSGGNMMETEILKYYNKDFWDALVEKDLVVVGENPTLFRCPFYRATNLGKLVIRNAIDFDKWRSSLEL